MTGCRASTKLPARAGGFTLVEVLLAFVVFAISFTVVLEILSGSMRNTARAKDYTEVALIAQSVMDEVGLEVPLESGAASNGESGDYQWELRISPYTGDTGQDKGVDLSAMTGIELLEIEVTIDKKDDPRQQSDRFSSVRAVLVRQ